MPLTLWNTGSFENPSQIVPKGPRNSESYATENTSRHQGHESVPNDIRLRDGVSQGARPRAASDHTDGRPNELEIPVTENTIATVHTHNTGARSTPSAADVKRDLPGFVKSQSYIFVTIPGTNHYAMVELD